MREKGVSFSPNEDQDSSGDLNSPFNPSDRGFEKSIEPLEIAQHQAFQQNPRFYRPNPITLPNQRKNASIYAMY